jgi:hypothetical protein
MATLSRTQSFARRPNAYLVSSFACPFQTVPLGRSRSPWRLRPAVRRQVGVDNVDTPPIDQKDISSRLCAISPCRPVFGVSFVDETATDENYAPGLQNDPELNGLRVRQLDRFASANQTT